jgi:serine O-acetyltransferase
MGRVASVLRADQYDVITRINSMAAWQRDMTRNAQRQGWSQFALSWILSPGFRTVMLYRITRSGFAAGSLPRIFSRLLWWHACKTTACQFSPQAEIGPGLYLPHPLGIVVGEGVIIGQDVTLYQNVTLGRSSASATGYPVIEDDVIVYAGAVIIGNVCIGSGAVIAANAVVTSNVSPKTLVGGIPARELRLIRETL